jgi:hypothetical protein
MRRNHVLVIAAALAAGYIVGNLQLLRLPLAFAQDEQAPSEEAAKKILAANDALRAAMDSLKTEGFYNSATNGLNAYAVMVGGVDAQKDLEEGKGVDPETFAALYAGDAIEAVAEHLSRDEEGRLTYKNKIVRIYPISKLKKLHAKRLELIGEAPEKAPGAN